MSTVSEMDDPSSKTAHGTDTDKSTADRIRDAALASFATRGVAGTSMRHVADVADVSVGLVQYHFGTKASLRTAVDQHVLAVIAQATLAAPLPEPPEDPLAELGRRVVSVMSDHPDAVRYVGRLLVEGDDVAMTIFDGLVALTSMIWDQFDTRGLLPDDQDRPWNQLLCIVLIVGSAILRDPIERHLPEPFADPAQLDRWDRAVYNFLRQGIFRRDAEFFP